MGRDGVEKMLKRSKCNGGGRCWRERRVVGGCGVHCTFCRRGSNVGSVMVGDVQWGWGLGRRRDWRLRGSVGPETAFFKLKDESEE